MERGQESRWIIALIGVIAVGVVLALFGVLRFDLLDPPAAPSHSAAVPGAGAEPAAPARAAGEVPAGASVGTVAGPAGAPVGGPAVGPSAAPGAPAAPAAPAATAPEPVQPSFDIVRVEPNGDSVIAGRAMPGAVIEMLRDGQVHARTPADQSGLFALVPPPLPPGSHQIVIESIAPDGTRQRSRESVTIVVSADRARPLVAMASPDKPTVLLSTPEPAGPAPVPAAPPPAASAGNGAAPPAPGPAASPAEVKIVTVEAEEGGRLFVSGQGTPGATVRLYLNESFIAPGGVGADGRVSFAIGRGVRPGDYRVRIDDVDPVSGTVKSRAEVAFNVPPALILPPPPAVAQLPGGSGAAGPAPARPSPAATGSNSPGAAATAGAAPPFRPPGQQVAAASGGGRETPAGTVVIPDISTAIVTRGENLWRISQRIYGKGLRYTVIYNANQGQIRNPHRIYPGQVFVLPGEQQAKSN